MNNKEKEFICLLEQARCELSKIWDSPTFEVDELLSFVQGLREEDGDPGFRYSARLLNSPLEEFKKEQEKFRRQLDIAYSRLGIVLSKYDFKE